MVVDAFALTSAGARSGVGTYTRHLLEALAAQDEGEVWALADPAAVLPPEVRRVPAHRSARRARAEVVEHAVRLPVDLARRRPAGTVFYNPGFHAPVGVGHPWVQALLDVIPLVRDDPDLVALKARWRRFGPRYRRADAVIAISAHAADEGSRVLGLDRDRVVVAPLGVDPAFRPLAAEPTDPPYLLMVGQYSRRKGHDLAFAVVDALADRGHPHHLRVVGQDHGWAKGELEGLRLAARHPERIELCGYVPDLVVAYQGASAVLVPSRSEGFGLTALEGMACGRPVVAFANTALTELVAGGGVLVPDGDAAVMADEVDGILRDRGWADEVGRRGVAKAAGYTWERTAAIHAEVFRAVAAGDLG